MVNLLDYAKGSGTDLKTTSKRGIQKAKEATDYLINYHLQIK